MGRKRKKPRFDAEKIQKEMMDITLKLYEAGRMTSDKRIKVSLRSIAEELDISVSKVVKLLITAGAYTSDLAERIGELYDAGESIQDIQNELGISRATVHSYLPYRKGIYNVQEASLKAGRIRRYRKRCAAVEALRKRSDMDDLWKCIVLFEGYAFCTAKGLKFRYKVKGGELFVDRKESSKSITKSTVELAFKNGMELMETEGVVSGPKKLEVFGASYLYPMFIRFEIIKGKNKPEK